MILYEIYSDNYIYQTLILDFWYNILSRLKQFSGKKTSLMILFRLLYMFCVLAFSILLNNVKHRKFRIIPLLHHGAGFQPTADSGELIFT